MRHLANGHTVAQFNHKKGFRIHLLVFALTIPVIWVIWFLTDRTYLWPIWQTGAWAIGLLFHYLGVYVFKNRKQ
jgi:hypothetical protein